MDTNTRPGGTEMTDETADYRGVCASARATVAAIAKAAP